MSAELAGASDREVALEREVQWLRQALAVAATPSEKGEGRFRRILESAADFAIVAMDLDGLVTFWSEGAYRTLGWTEQEMLGQAAAVFFTEEDCKAGVPQSEMAAALRDGRSANERWHLRKDGRCFWASGELMPLSDVSGEIQGFVKVLRDRTEQREAAERQRQDAEFMRGVLASSGDCIKVLDLDAKLLFMSEGGQRVMDVIDFYAIKGCPWPDFWQGQGNLDAKAAIETAKAGGTAKFHGVADTMAGRTRFWDVQVTPILGADGRPEKLLSISRDVSDAHFATVALKESEAHWRGLFEKLSEGLILGDLMRDAEGAVTDWRYLDVNPAWGELVGVSPATASGQTIRRLFPGIEDAWVDDMAVVVETRTAITFTRAVGGLGRWYEGRAFPLGGDRFAVLFLEVTACVQADARRIALVELDDRLRDMEDLAEMSFMAAAIIGRTLDVQRAGYATVNVDQDAVLIERDWTALGVASLAGSHRMREYGSYIDDLVRGETVMIAEAAADSRTVASAGMLRAIEATALINLPLIEQGKLVAFFYASSAEPRAWSAEDLGFMRNVAQRTRSAVERRRAEQSLRSLAASLERTVQDRTRELTRVWENSQDILVIIGVDGVFRAVNPAATRVLGWSEHEMLGRSLKDFVPPEDWPPYADGSIDIRRYVEPRHFENRYRHKDGSLRWLSWRAAAEDGVIYAYGRDVTAEKEQTAALKDAEDRLRQSQKMEAVGQLTGGIAHDFNNLLTGITGSLELLEKRVAQRRYNDVERYVAAAQGAAKRAAGLTHRLLAFSRRQTLDPSPTNVNRLVAGLEEMIRRTVGPQVTLDVVGAVGLWPALVDPNQLENAVLNLCINARDAMPDGGRITIETANNWLDARAAGDRDLAPGQYLSLCVTDTGTGMTPEVIARAFDPFFTTKPIGQGTGLGLSMIYGFARQSGGHVRIYSEVGVGTTMCIYLPRHYGEEKQPITGGEPSSLSRAEQGETVLVVDDEPTVRMLVTEVLEELDYTAIEATDGPSGLKILHSDVRVDLLVTDVGLPGGMNGRQVADAARVVRPELKVLFITGYAENAAVGNGHLEPGMHLLTKPFAMEVLATRIRELINPP